VTKIKLTQYRNWSHFIETLAVLHQLCLWASGESCIATPKTRRPSPFCFLPTFNLLHCLITPSRPPYPPWERERERGGGCIVGVCCHSARARIDSKLQSLLRTPHSATWPQNNTETYTRRLIQYNMKYTLCCPILPYFLFSPMTWRSHADFIAMCQLAANVMCQWRKLWVWFTDVNAITAPPHFTEKHTHTRTHPL